MGNYNPANIPWYSRSKAAQPVKVKEGPGTTIRTTKVFDRIVSYHKSRVIVLQGGSSSSKTFSALQYLIYIASNSPVPLFISIVGETLPALKRGAYRDFMNILGDSYDEEAHNKSDLSYTIGKCTIEFFSADMPSKVRGPRRDILFVNECNNIDYETYTQLEIRTRRRIILDYNPTSEFWAHEFLIGKPDVAFDVSTYLDNQYLDKSIIRSLESRRYDALGNETDWWKVYGKGEVGSKEGLVYPQFSQIDSMPDLPRVYGLDFGFSNDVAALVQVCVSSSSIYMNELMYDLGMTNQDISEHMSRCNIRKHSDLIYADCAEPKSIVELCRMGWIVKPSVKGKDSITSGIDWVKTRKLYVTKDSTNLIKELRNYRWEKDREGKPTNHPVDKWCHLLDALRYAVKRYSGAVQHAQFVKMKF